MSIDSSNRADLSLLPDVAEITTNIFVSGLAPTVTEDTIRDVFGKFGAIESVKVMWPRSEEERQRRRNCGFVNYFNRQDAEDAMVRTRIITRPLRSLKFLCIRGNSRTRLWRVCG
jgi:RNA recognition motif-containing protein